MPIDNRGYWYTPGRAIDVPPRKYIWNWVHKNYSRSECDFGGHYLHWDYKPNYLEKCKSYAAYKYLHIGEDRKNWLPGYRCEQHRIKEQRANLREIKL